MNADEIRALEDMPTQAGGVGETYFINGNMVSLEHAANNVPKGAQGKVTT